MAGSSPAMVSGGVESAVAILKELRTLAVQITQMLQCGMAKFRTLRGWSAILLAGFLTFAILIPTIDTFVCIADIGQTVADTASLTQASKDTPIQHDDGDASCIHGHCHHWVGVAKIGERLAFEVTLTDGEAPRGLYDSPPSAPQIELLRPPRA